LVVNDKRINSKLKAINPQLRMDLLSSKEQEYLVKIDSALQEIEHEKEEVLRTYKLTRVSRVSISEKSKVSRPTIIKYDILNKYIDL
jgi:hypothetical protein